MTDASKTTDVRAETAESALAAERERADKAERERDAAISALSAIVHCQSSVTRSALREAAADALRSIGVRPNDYPDQSPFVARANEMRADRDAIDFPAALAAAQADMRARSAEVAQNAFHMEEFSPGCEVKVSEHHSEIADAILALPISGDDALAKARKAARREAFEEAAIRVEAMGMSEFYGLDGSKCQDNVAPPSALSARRSKPDGTIRCHRLSERFRVIREKLHVATNEDAVAAIGLDSIDG
jgi:8-oxo-dGTP pyrophosphatase MutT (NUDIX family)